MVFRDIFDVDLDLGPKVCVLGPGPKGRPHHHQIPSDFCVMAGNKGVLIESVPVDVWVLCHGDQPWVPRALATFDGIRIFSDAAAERTADALTGKPHCYRFTPEPELLDPVAVPSIHRKVRYGPTVTGVAVQLAWNLGAREILLCGIDMSGDGYWDGSHNPDRVHGDCWEAVPRFNRMLRFLEADGVRVASLSETRLEVPRLVGPTS